MYVCSILFTAVGYFLCVVRLGLVSLDLSNNLLSELGLITRTLVSLASLKNLLLMGNPLAVEFTAHICTCIFKCFIYVQMFLYCFKLTIHKF